VADQVPGLPDERAWLREHIALILCNRYQFPATEIAHLKGWAESRLREAGDLIDLVRAYEAGLADYRSGADLDQTAVGDERTGPAYRCGVHAAKDKTDAIAPPERARSGGVDG
jgi:hypothetical protein